MSRACAALLIIAFIADLLTASTCASAQEESASQTPKAARSRDQLPLEILKVVVAPGARDDYFASLRAFAERFGFAIRIAPTAPNGDDFATQMYREDIKVLGANPFRAETFQLGFYACCPGDTDSTTRQNVSLMVAELKARLSKTKGIVVQVGQ